MAFHIRSPFFSYEKLWKLLKIRILLAFISFTVGSISHTAALQPLIGRVLRAANISVAVKTSWPSLQYRLITPFRGLMIRSQTSLPNCGSEKSYLKMDLILHSEIRTLLFISLFYLFTDELIIQSVNLRGRGNFGLIVHPFINQFYNILMINYYYGRVEIREEFK